MGRGLYTRFPAFAAAFDAAAGEVQPYLDAPLTQVMWGRDEQLLTGTGYAQPALFVVGVALFRLLESWGVRPDYVAGHSVGEIAAAHVAGVLSLTDAARLVAGRGRLMQQLPEGGAMLSVGAGRDEVQDLLVGYTDRVGVAAVNGPRSVVVSGDRAVLRELAAGWQEQGRRVTWLRVSHGFHSPLMRAMLPRWEPLARGVSYRQPQLAMVSTVTGGLAQVGELTDPMYWVSQVEQPVLFGDAVDALLGAGVSGFLELGPGQVLSGLVADRAEDAERQVYAVSVAVDTNDEVAGLMSAAAGWHVNGFTVNWSGALTNPRTRPLDLPTYPFQHRRYWLGVSGSGNRGIVRDISAGEDRTPAPDFRALPEVERRQVVISEVRAHAAAALGHPSADDIDPDRLFVEQGFDSMSGMDLQVRLSAAMGLRIAKKAVLQYDTPEALADYLMTLLDAEPSAEPYGQVAGPTRKVEAPPAEPMAGIERLYRQAMSGGRDDVAMDLLRVVSRLRDAFGATLAAQDPAIPVELAAPTDAPTLVCFPSFAALSGQFHYARLAKPFEGRRGIAVFLNPGFEPDEAVPADLDALVNLHVRAVTAYTGDHPIVLLGHSAGALIAHAVATGLEKLGRPPAGLILLDPPWPDELDDGALTALARELLVRQDDDQRVGGFDCWLSTVGAYIRLMDGWTPQGHGIRTLLLRATGVLPAYAGTEGTGRRFRADWRLPHEALDVPGDHFTLVEGHAETTAEAVNAWIDGLNGPTIALP
jgi:malonyl CoA-acyl carrier protein transacylase/acyl carrier protein